MTDKWVWLKVLLPDGAKPVYAVAMHISKGDTNMAIHAVYNMSGSDITEEIKRKEIKMTREEATHAIFNSQAGRSIGARDIPIKQFVEYVEALGLIKFDEERKDGRRFLVKGVDDKEHLIEADVIIKLVKEWPSLVRLG